LEAKRMEVITIKNETDFPGQFGRSQLVDFMHESLDEFRDSKKDINNALDYAFSTDPGKGGFVLLGIDNGNIVSGLVMNKTGHVGYIPENILVYVATKASERGKGLGRKIITKAIETAGTDIALHVEYDNPAKKLYERLGFISKYAEMRYKK